MGFWNSLGKGILGAGAGLIGSGGNPLGAIAGGISGLTSGGDTSSSTQSQQTSGSRQTQLRDYTPEEQALFDQAQQGLMASGENLTPEAIEKLRQERYDLLYGSASSEINRSSNLAQQSGYAANARRGLSGSTNTQTMAQGREGDRQRSLGLASTQSHMSADQMVQMEQEQRRANAAAYMDRMNNMWNQRLIGSKVVTTGSGSAAGTQTTPDNFLGDAAGLVGNAAGQGYKLGDMFGGW